MAKNPEVKEVSIDSVKTDIEQLSPEDKKTLLEKLSSEVQAEKAEIASEIQDLKEKVVSLNKEDITFKLYNGVEKSAIIKAIEAVSDESKKTSLIKALKDKDVVAFQKALWMPEGKTAKSADGKFGANTLLTLQNEEYDEEVFKNPEKVKNKADKDIAPEIGEKIEGETLGWNDMYKISDISDLPKNYVWEEKLKRVYKYELNGKSYVFFANGRVNVAGEMGNSKDIIASLMKSDGEKEVVDTENVSNVDIKADQYLSGAILDDIKEENYTLDYFGNSKSIDVSVSTKVVHNMSWGYTYGWTSMVNSKVNDYDSISLVAEGKEVKIPLTSLLNSKWDFDKKLWEKKLDESKLFLKSKIMAETVAKAIRWKEYTFTDIFGNKTNSEAESLTTVQKAKIKKYFSKFDNQKLLVENSVNVHERDWNLRLRFNDSWGDEHYNRGDKNEKLIIKDKELLSLVNSKWDFDELAFKKLLRAIIVNIVENYEI